MSDSPKWHKFFCEGRTWTVTRRATQRSKQTGLCFRRDGETRFLAFSRGALPSDRELQSMSEAVLCALLHRAVVNHSTRTKRDGTRSTQ
jgi:hypothetical protein